MIIVFLTLPDCVGMSPQAFRFRHSDNIVRSFQQRLIGISDDTGLFHKGFHVQHAVEFSRTAGGQYMVGPGKIVAQGLK